jgi:hypothetical protein
MQLLSFLPLWVGKALFFHDSTKGGVNLTKIELLVRGTEAKAVLHGPLTSGMVGLPIELRCNSVWDNLSKTLVCRSCVDGTPIEEVRTIVNVGGQAVVAHEVMLAGRTLYLGVEGRNVDGTVVFPTVWACCGKIQSGANADADPSIAATPEAWEQVLLQMGSLDELNTDQKGTLVAAINEAMTKGDGQPGKNAYTYAVEAGYKGTEEAFMESLMMSHSAFATDDGNGNVVVTVMGAISATDDGNGNVEIM